MLILKLVRGGMVHTSKCLQGNLFLCTNIIP